MKGHSGKSMRIVAGVSLAAVLAIAGATSGVLQAQQAPAADPFKSLYFRELGPTRQGGRFVDFAVVEATPRVFYAASLRISPTRPRVFE